MAIIHKSRVKETASNKPNASTAFNLPGSAPTGYRTFASTLSNGNTVPVLATNGTDWESGLYTYTAGTPNTLVRTTVYDSSTGIAIDFSAGANVELFIHWPAKLAADTENYVTRLNTFVDKGSFASGTCTCDYNAGAVQKVTATGAFTLALSNWPASGTYGQMLIEAVNFGTNCTLPTVSWKKPDGTTTTTFSASGYSFLSSGTQYIQLWSTAGSATIYGTVT